MKENTPSDESPISLKEYVAGLDQLYKECWEKRTVLRKRLQLFQDSCKHGEVEMPEADLDDPFVAGPILSCSICGKSL